MIEEVTRYLELRRALGFKLEGQEALLRKFASFAESRGDTRVRAETAIQWARLSASENERARRLRAVTIFARHMNGGDVQNEIPPQGVFASRRTQRTPYPFTAADVSGLMMMASRLGPTGSLRPWTYSTLFGLLATAGLRISEALALLIADIGPDGLHVRTTKFRKNRLVPLHRTSQAALDRYLRRRLSIAGADTHLFVSLHGTRLRYSTVNETFLELVRKMKLHPGPGLIGPRLHDLRHHFAVRALESCPLDANNIEKRTLAVSTYMGHAQVASTYWYLRATPRLLTNIADASETSWWKAGPR